MWERRSERQSKQKDMPNIVVAGNQNFTNHHKKQISSDPNRAVYFPLGCQTAETRRCFLRSWVRSWVSLGSSESPVHSQSRQERTGNENVHSTKTWGDSSSKGVTAAKCYNLLFWTNPFKNENALIMYLTFVVDQWINRVSPKTVFHVKPHVAVSKVSLLHCGGILLKVAWR